MTRGTRPGRTSVNGDFVFVNVTADTYTLEVTMSGFKTVQRKGVAVSPADRVAIPTITLEIGGVTETVDVKGDTPLIQAYTGERSFTVATDSVANLPLADRNFATLATLAPGVDGTARVGGGGATNFMMDGASTMDTGSNRLLVAVNVESIAEVKVLASGYQAEYGRSSGLQITAVTRGGTNRFRGSVYDVERNSEWNSNTKTNKLNGDPKTIAKQRESGIRSADRSGSRAAETGCSFSTAMSISRGPAATTWCVTGCRRCSSVRAISRRPPTTTGIRIRSFATRRSPAPATPRVRPPAMPTAASSGAFRQAGCIRSA